MSAFFHGLVLGAVEGLTEFLPVSSTGHLILAGAIMDFGGDKAVVFEIVIQFGAILAVVWLYRRRFLDLIRPRPGAGFAGMRGLAALFLTTLPPGLLGLALHDVIRSLFTPASVALSLAVGALCMLIVERRGEPATVAGLDLLTPKMALGVGCFQCLALWPGFSRSAATIMGGMLLGARRKVAAEYSFLAAVPLLCAASGYSLLKNRGLLGVEDLPLFVWGGVCSFLFALAAVKTFIGLLGRMTLRPFAWYRLALSPLVYWFLAG